ncbi:hypothetical protein H1R20_g7580, partial [Candolleomyces eurysporus]
MTDIESSPSTSSKRQRDEAGEGGTSNAAGGGGGADEQEAEDEEMLIRYTHSEALKVLLSQRYLRDGWCNHDSNFDWAHMGSTSGQHTAQIFVPATVAECSQMAMAGALSAEAYTHVVSRGCRCAGVYTVCSSLFDINTDHDVNPPQDGLPCLSGQVIAFPKDNAEDIDAPLKKLSLKLSVTHNPFPFTVYFISTSHNTYLPTAQILGTLCKRTPTFSVVAVAALRQEWLGLSRPRLVGVSCPSVGGGELVRITKEAQGGRLVQGPLKGVDDEWITPKDLEGRIVVMAEYYLPPLLRRSGTSTSVAEGDGSKTKRQWSLEIGRYIV